MRCHALHSIRTSPPARVGSGGSRRYRLGTIGWPLGLDRTNVNTTLQTARELDDTRTHGEQRVIATATNAVTRVKVGAALTHDNRASSYFLAREPLDAKSLGLGIATVLC